MNTNDLNDILEYLGDDKMDPKKRAAIARAREGDPRTANTFRALQDALRTVIGEDEEAMSIISAALERSPTVPDLSPAIHPDTSHGPTALPAKTAMLWEMRVPLLAETATRDVDQDVEATLTPHWGLSRDKRTVVIRCPINNSKGVSFPYRVALLEYRSEAGQVVSKVLLPVERNERLGLFQAQMRVSELLPKGPRDCDAGQLTLWEVCDNPDVLARLTLDDVSNVMQRPEVRYDDELSRCLGRLKARLTKPGEKTK